MTALQTPTTGVVVTGGGSGIGRASCVALAELGRPIAAWDLNGDGAEETAAQCRDKFGVAAVARQIDVTDRAAVNEAVLPTVAALGSVGGLVHAAGTYRATMDDNFGDDDQWDTVLAVNLTAGATLVQAFIGALRDARPGSAVVQIASIDGTIGQASIPSYNTSKAGLMGLVRSLAHKYGREGIRINAVCPGFIDTSMMAPTLSVDVMKQRLEKTTPIGRIGQPEEIGRVVRFLLSDDASYVHGASWIVDGGFTAGGGRPFPGEG